MKSKDDVEATAHVLAALRTAGLSASPEQLQRLVEGFKSDRQQLEAMRRWIDETVEPAHTFSPTSFSSAPPDEAAP